MVDIYEGLCCQVMAVLFECACDIILGCHVCDVAEDRHGLDCQCITRMIEDYD